MGEFKWRELGIPYSLEGVKPPTADRVKNAKELMDTESYQDYMNVYMDKKKPDGNIGLFLYKKSLARMLSLLFFI